MPINRMFYLTAINSIFDAQVCVWAKNKFYGQKITIAFRVVDGVYQPPVSQVESQTVRWLFHGTNHPKKVEQRMAKAVVARIPEMA